MKFGQTQSKIKRVITAWNVLRKIENNTGERSIEQKTLLRCYHICLFQEVRQLFTLVIFDLAAA